MDTLPHEPAEPFDFTLDRKAEVPIGVQLVWAVRTRIGDGRLAPGSRLPALRDVADSLQLNANTVRTAYSRLERDGLVESRQGSGTFVCDSRQETAALAIARLAAAEALQSGVDPREVAAALYSAPTQRAPDDGADVARRRELKTQISALSRMLDDLRAEHPSIVRLTRSADAGPPALPRLPSAVELEATRLELLRKLSAAQAAVDGLELESDQHARDGATQKRAASKPARKRSAASASGQAAGKRAPTKPPRTRPSAATSC
jgi:DNA-binding transcriptional regulator YhcF (GntR family)